MLLLAGIAASLAVVFIVPRLRFLGGGSDQSLGSMSQQWLAEHRASRPSRP